MHFHQNILLALLLCGLAPMGNSHAESEPGEKNVQLPPVRFTAPVPLTLTYRVEKPLKVNARSPKSVRVGARKLKATSGGAPFQTTVEPGDIENGALHVAATYYVCEDHPDALCWLRRVNFEIPVAQKGKVASKLELQTPEFPPIPANSSDSQR